MRSKRSVGLQKKDHHLDDENVDVDNDDGVDDIGDNGDDDDDHDDDGGPLPNRYEK